MIDRLALARVVVLLIQTAFSIVLALWVANTVSAIGLEAARLVLTKAAPTSHGTLAELESRLTVLIVTSVINGVICAVCAVALGRQATPKS